MLRHYPQWRVLEVFLPRVADRDWVLRHSVFTTIMMTPLQPLSEAAAAQKLGWWAEALQALRGARNDVGSHQYLQHPALRQLQAGRSLDAVDPARLRAWLADLADCLVLAPVADLDALWCWCRRLASILHELERIDNDGDANGAGDFVYTDRLFLQQVHGLAGGNWLYRNLPLALRARHGLQIDTGPAAEGLSAQQSFAGPCLPEALIDELLHWRQRRRNGYTAITPVQRLWQAAGDHLAQRLRRKRKMLVRRPIPVVTPALAWRCWRLARR